MAEWGLSLAAGAFSYLGLSLFALRQRLHWQAVSACSDRRASAPRSLRRGGRWLGGAGLASSLLLSWLAQGASFGSILWVLLLALAGVGLTLTLTWRPRWLAPLAWCFQRVHADRQTR
jgi:hypothetical protein